MTTVAGGHLFKTNFMRRGRKRHWAEGRMIAIMPDVPGKRFNPEDSIFLRTPQEQETGRNAIRAILDQMLHDGKPSWYKPESAPEKTGAS